MFASSIRTAPTHKPPSPPCFFLRDFTGENSAGEIHVRSVGDGTFRDKNMVALLN